MTISIDPQGWGEANPQDIRSILRSVHEVFAPHFGTFMNPNSLLVIHSANHPVTYRTHHVILLSATNRFWCQYAYQFAHEYCHYQIHKDVPQHLRWFEESLCELASYFFLPLITALWKISPPYPAWASYADYFTEYVLKDQEKAQSIDLNFSSTPSMLAYLAEHEYNREINAYIANALKPVFQENPTFWSALPLLGDIPAGLSFPDSLRFWSTRLPDCQRKSIQHISEIFSLKL